MNTLLEINGLAKKFDKNFALDDFDLLLEEGKILGLLGPNGSGKTTLLKLIAGLLKPHSGEIYIDGNQPSYLTKAYVSFLPDRDFLIDDIKINQMKDFYIDFFSDFDSSKFDELLSFMNLDNNQRIKTLSKGMKEKLNLSFALSRRARLYLLDEPLGGVDPVTRDKIINAIIKNYMENSSMIISTHLVDYIEPVLDQVVFLRNGKTALSGNAEDLRAEKGKSIDEIYREVYQND